MIAMTDDYRRLSVVEKRALDLRRARDAAVRCPQCEMSIMPVDLLAHQEQRCAGRPEPGPGAKWVPWREARAVVSERTLIRWVERGFVRFRGERGDREYLYRDLAIRVSQMRGFRRR